MSSLPIYQYPITVVSDDIDLLGHVNNCEYLRWMERAATAHAAALGWSFDALSGIGRMWVARRHWVEYLKPCFEGQRLTLYTWVQDMRRVTSLRRYALVREGEVVMAGATEWAFVDAARQRPCAVDEVVQASFTLVPPGDPRLQALGLARPMRYLPAGYES